MTEDMLKTFLSCARLNDLFWPIVQLSWGVGTVIIYIKGIDLIGIGDIKVGTLISFTWYVTMFWQPIMHITDFYNTLISNISAGERVFEIMDIKPTIYSKEHSSIMPEIKGNIEFNNVSFSYDEIGRAHV